MNDLTNKPKSLPILNIAGYQFVRLDQLESLRESLQESALLHQLKGTILLAEEGINLFLAGLENDIQEFLNTLRADPRLRTFTTKDSWSSSQPFRKLLIKIKKEIIRMNHPTITPEKGRAKFIAPEKLKQWLDQGHDDLGRPVVMIDTPIALKWNMAALIMLCTSISINLVSFRRRLNRIFRNLRIRPW